MISRRKGAAAGLMAGVLAVMPVMGSRAMAAPVINSGEADAQSSHMAGPGQEETVRPERFVLPAGARVLVAVEGTGGSSCQVSVYERETEGSAAWSLKMATPGYLGHNGIDRKSVV